MSLSILYKATRTGAIQQWSISVHVGGVYTTSSGKVGGVMTEHSTICKGKNIGKANETSPEQQALKEAEAKHTKQIAKGYTGCPTGEVKVTLPPLAHKVQDHLGKIDFPWVGFDKLDGLRCTMFYRDEKVFFQTRGGKQYPTIEAIADELKRVWFDAYPDLTIDGELYCHGMHLEDIGSAVKKHNEDTHKINFHVFDLVHHDEEKPYSERYAEYRKELTDYDKYEGPLEKVFPIIGVNIGSEGAMWCLHDRAIRLGFEGIVLRKPTSIFKFNYRTDEFLKLKVRHDAEYKIVGFELDKKGGAIPVLECDVSGFPVSRKDPTLNPKGAKATFKAPFAGSHQDRKDIYAAQDDIIGNWMNASYEALSKYGIPAKPISEGLRDCDVFGNPLT